VATTRELFLEILEEESIRLNRRWSTKA